MRAYLLAGDAGLYLVVGADPVLAAECLSAKLGVADVESWSVSGAWEICDGAVINAGRLWPHFTATPPERFVREALP